MRSKSYNEMWVCNGEPANVAYLFAAAEFALIHVQVCENVFLCGTSGDASLKSEINHIHETFWAVKQTQLHLKPTK